MSHTSSIKSTLIEGTSAAIKRTFALRTTSMLPVSPQKKKSKVSAIHTALDHSLKSLMKFLKWCIPAGYKEQVERMSEEENERYQEHEDRAGETKKRQAEKTQEDAKLCQQRFGEKKYKKQILAGERSPGGTK
jgi:hypothetical protein